MMQVLSTPSQLGQVLRSARRAKKLTQGQAATRLGLSQSRLSALELEPEAISAEQLLALVSLYGLELLIQSKGPAPTSEETEW
ncbi:helix-turn-helix transcriptional regulator [Cupriavidus sp. WKF15]|uniref:helix-turn-helix domain-containing protein n=1 Tax=Cupriavidus sp. WKF15 TaxID=3032282 RepID=UPI0023E13690|nr:helix-turn-helix transcriptional regulator [Cupriavidus sp. WKF15]WER48409.1 helix-turn-helix transcriptional regulator [Cupriavidus sp. WKF15]